METTNLKKHTVKNPISKFFLNNFLNTLLKEIRPFNPSSILDVGAGEGFTLQRLKDEKIGKKLEGIEYMDEAIEIGKKLHPTIVLKKGDIYKLPYKDNTFDLIICTEVLEHLEEPSKALDELTRVSARNLILSVPNEPFFTIQRFFRGQNMLKLGAHPEHIQYWTAREFVKFVQEKAVIKTVRYPIPWTMVIAQE